MTKYNYAIEIGGGQTKIYQKDCGLVLCEPTLVAAEPTSSGYVVLGLGKKAKALMGKTSDEVEVFSPIANGKINNFEYAEELLQYFFDKIDYKKNSSNIVILVGCGITEADKKLYRDLLHKVGFKEVALIPTAVCTCVGAGKNISSTKINMVVNIGGGNVDIAVINRNSIIKGATLGIGGRNIDSVIAQTIAYDDGIVIGLASAEMLKNEVASLYYNDSLNMEVTGVDVESKVPRSYIITSGDLYPIILPFFDEIIRASDVTITSLPPDISTDIINNGVLFAGGVSQISGLGDYLKKNFRYPVRIVEDGEFTSINGAGKLLDDQELLNKIVENF